MNDHRRFQIFSRVPPASATAAPLLLDPVAAPAQANARTVTEPPTARILRAPPGVRISPNVLMGLAPAAAPAAPAATPGGEAVLNLNIQYTDATIFNPATGQKDAVKLRSYRDARVQHRRRYRSWRRPWRSFQARRSASR